MRDERAALLEARYLYGTHGSRFTRLNRRPEHEGRDGSLSFDDEGDAG
jgi:hypothetical protein